mgnify:CR=1 FL=1
MEINLVSDWSAEAIRLALWIGGPLLAVALLVGLVVGALQTLTQMHEPVVSLIPRLAAVLVAGLALLPWMLGTLASYANSLIGSLPNRL